MNDFMERISVLLLFIYFFVQGTIFLAPNVKIWFSHQHTVLENLLFPTKFIQIPINQDFTLSLVCFGHCIFFIRFFSMQHLICTQIVENNK